jgi:hypothetical protein
MQSLNGKDVGVRPLKVNEAQDQIPRRWRWWWWWLRASVRLRSAVPPGQHDHRAHTRLNFPAPVEARRLRIAIVEKEGWEPWVIKELNLYGDERQAIRPDVSYRLSTDG